MEKRNFLKWTVLSSISAVLPRNLIASEASNFESILLKKINGKIHLFNVYKQNTSQADLTKTLELQKSLVQKNPLDISGLSKQIIRDFKENNICIVDGWILSRTEVSLCGLAANHQLYPSRLGFRS